MSISSFFIISKSGGMIYKFLKQDEKNMKKRVMSKSSPNRNDKTTKDGPNMDENDGVNAINTANDANCVYKTDGNKDGQGATSNTVNSSGHTERIGSQIVLAHLQTTNLNDLLVLNSTLHTIHQMATTIYGQSQKFYIYLHGLTLSMFRTMTGYTFVFIGDEKAGDKLVDSVYREFNLYVLRNPAYMDDMPINLCTFKPYKYF
ncbi:hypothetical protein VCUG_02024 [Vavraia culicis subsp. floridensis]|uniref:Trafficking protein particle complex subunit n=1 Tax=Vavraia culicis (isolate floridensis) TaxID=948595 RepID=L2GTR4_VAVCU|nr:uncharacterized protein VCUG_02024 [Vavraia culicis subsp. floridensis]ELA46480.1 hypothetical protein VCUG_02024 [Vavraia culicis subsp. floridensis]